MNSRWFLANFENGRRDAITCIGMNTIVFLPQIFSSQRAVVIVPIVVEVSEFDDELHGDAKIMEKDNALRRALSQLANDFGKESMGPFGIELKSSMISSLMLNVQELNDGSTCFYMEDFSVRAAAFIGRIVEIYGREASGETTLALHVIKEAQKLGGYCAYLDVENALDPCLAEAMGIDTENLLIVQPDSTENLLSVVDTLTKSGSIDVIVFDSVRFSAKSSHGLGCMDEVISGGIAVKFYAALRLRMMRTKLFKIEDKTIKLILHTLPSSMLCRLSININSITTLSNKE
ncbi:DNA repair protein recA [Citrus sinensis]|uniref:DNA repair protein recA n=1 Tax=Citrus sinensis TaxID=2711 RepID=A0ACB8HXK0_CITSI|nr:DNA repair protein recA [Citrus sinensis]